MPLTSKRWRYIFNALMVVSLLLMLATMGLWGVSVTLGVTWDSTMETA